VGTHTLWVAADTWSNVSESDETNNFTSVTFTVTAPAQPDLVVDSITPNATSVSPGSAFSFSYVIKDIGAAPAGSSWAGIYLDGQSPSNELAGSAGYNSIAGMASGGSVNATNSFSTSGLSLGQHTLWIKADYWSSSTGQSGNGNVAESDETNNWTSVSFNVGTVSQSIAANTGASSVTVAAGQTVEIGSGFSGEVSFTADTGTLKLDDPSSFAGTVAGMSGQDVIDFAGIDPSKVQQPAYSGSSSGGTLGVTDGMHSANIALLGNYLSSTFVASSDGHGGTSVVDPPASTANALLTQPHV
jgi:hypothetical protein